MRQILIHGMFWFALLMSCSDSSDKDQSGVTSTGNAGDVAGYVVAQHGVGGLGRTHVAAAVVSVDSALVQILGEGGKILDSVRTNREGAFRFRNLPEGMEKVVASLNGMVASLDFEDIQEGEQISRLELGAGSQWIADTLPVGIYSAEPGPVWSPITGLYSYQADSSSIRFLRTFDSDTLTDTTWKLSFLDPEMLLWNPNQNGCSNKARFFSLAPGVVTENNWFYNGDLAEDFGTGNTLCSQALNGLPEMNRFGMSGFEMLFLDSSRFKGVFYDREYCLTEAVAMQDLYGATLPSAARMETQDCNSFRILQGDSDTTVVRVLWLDIAAEWGEEEIRRGDSSWVHRGPWREFSLERVH